MKPRKLLHYCRSQLPALMLCLRQAVEIESPSRSKPCVDRMAKFFARELRHCGARVRLLPHRTAGCAVLAELWPGRRVNGPRGKPILILGHLDTVWDVGTLERMPFRVANGRAYGPGIFDMKSGIVCGFWAVKALQSMQLVPRSPVRFLLTPDEEISSVAFRKTILSEARRARAVLVLEPAAGAGALKTARKGVGEFRVTAYGRSAHAGIDPASGVNAIAELAHQLVRIEGFARPAYGLTVSAGVIDGGTRTNVVPERATALIDVRIPRMKDGKVIERKLRSLKPVIPGSRLVVEGEINRPPLEHTMAEQLFERARELGRKLGMDVREASTGGGSDGNFTAALGIPTLDGLGGVGGGAHARDEHVVVRELPRRAALLAALLVTL